MSGKKGYSIIMLLVLVSILAVGLLVAVPVWQTQMQREKEEELIFRGNQFVEAIRLYQQKNPGQLPRSLDELVKKRYLRRLFPDPMVKSGKWDVILAQQVSSRRAPGKPEPGGQKLLIVPEAALASVDNPLVIGVVSSSPKKAIRIYNDEDTYNKWFFYFGQDANVKPEITYYGQTEKK
jgi:type II secretory pathway pseudopilin PulG